MEALPHRYRVHASTGSQGVVSTSSQGVPTLSVAAPREFGGPGDLWSPETLLVAAVADCFLLTFRAIAQAARLDWHTLDCEVEGVLERTEGQLRFTGFTLYARLALPTAGQQERAAQLLDKAKEHCLVTRSLTVPVTLQHDITSSP